MSNNPEHLLKLLEEEKRAREEAEKRAEEEKRAREEAEKRAEEEKRAREEAEKRAEEAEKTAKENEAKTKPLRKAIQDGSTLMLRNGPFANLQSLDSSSLVNFRSDALVALRYCVDKEELDTFSKGYRVYFSIPRKCDMSTLEQIRRESKGSSQKGATTTPRGTISSYTNAIFDIEPEFEKIVEKELDVWSKDLDAALQAGSKNAIGRMGAKELLLKWEANILAKEFKALNSKSSEDLTSKLLEDHILDPIMGIFKASGIEIDITSSTHTGRSSADYLVWSPNESENLNVQENVLFRQGKVPEKLFEFKLSKSRAYIVVEVKRMGLGAFVDGDKVLIRSGLNSLLKQCLVYMIVYGTDMVLLSDFKTSILMELNFDVDGSCVAKPSNKRDYEEELESRNTKRKDTHHIPVEKISPVHNDDIAAEQGEDISWVQMRQKKGENKVSVPLRYRTMSMYDTEYTQQAIIASAIYSKIKAGDRGKIRAGKQLTKLRQLATRTDQECHEHSEKKRKEKEMKEKGSVSRGASRIVRLSSQGLNVLQEGDNYWSQVYRIDKGAISLSFPWIDTNNCKNQDVVVKIYDIASLPYFGSSKSSGFHPIDELTEYVESMATNEIECYRRIKAYNDGSGRDCPIRSPNLYDSGRCILYKPSMNNSRPVHYVGLFLLLSHLEKTESQMTDTEIENDGLKQLGLLHSIGIEHGDIKPKNYFETHEGVHFFDFSHSRLYDGAVPDWRAQEECEKFKAIFTERSKSETADVSLVE